MSVSELRIHFFDQFAGNDRRPLRPAVVQVGQIDVVQPHQVQDRRVNIVNMHGRVDGAQADFVRRADDAVLASHRRPPSTS